jgi:hypothetical protein
MIRLIGFEDLGNNDAFTAKALEFRLQHSGMSHSTQQTFTDCSGVLPSGDLTLSNALPTAITRKKIVDKDDDDSDEERWNGKTGQRKGKTGIRNGFTTKIRYDDDDE